MYVNFIVLTMNGLLIGKLSDDCVVFNPVTYSRRNVSNM